MHAGPLTGPASQETECQLNWDQIAGNWKQVTGQVKQKWGKLTDDDIALVNGKRDELVGRIQERYGIAKEEADKQLKSWEGSVRW